MGYTIRAPKADKLTPEQVAERREQAYAAAAALTAAENAAKIAELTGKPAPEYATWVFDSATGAKVGYMTQWGVVPLPVEPAEREQVVIIPCGREKLDVAAPAGELYTSTYFAGNLAAARAIGGRVLVLSALHGLLDLDQVVEPYELKMGECGCVTAARVAEQAAALGLTDARVTVLAGKTYAAVVTRVWPDAIRPYDGSRGIGDHKARAKHIVEGAARAARLADVDATVEQAETDYRAAYAKVRGHQPSADLVRGALCVEAYNARYRGEHALDVALLARAEQLVEAPEAELADQQAPAEVPGEPRPALPAPLVGEQLALFACPPLDLLAGQFWTRGRSRGARGRRRLGLVARCPVVARGLLPVVRP